MELFSSHCNEHDTLQIFPPPFCQSWSALLCYGVPHGSCLGPFLILYCVLIPPLLVAINMPLMQMTPKFTPLCRPKSCCFKVVYQIQLLQIPPGSTSFIKIPPNKRKTTRLQELMALSTLEVLVLEAFRIAMFPTVSSFG